MNVILLLKILLVWSLTTKNYEMAYNMYIMFNIGVPNELIYPLRNQCQGNFIMNNFINHPSTRHLCDPYLHKLFEELRKSKYTKLKYWGNDAGFILKNDL